MNGCGVDEVLGLCFNDKHPETLAKKELTMCSQGPVWKCWESVQET